MTDAASRFAPILSQIEVWGADHASAAVVSSEGVVAVHGDQRHAYRWASVTKLATSLAVLVGVERGLLELDEAAGPPGATVRHLLAHASGLSFEGRVLLAQPGRRRIYSNAAFDALGALLAERSGLPFDAVLTDWILEPLGVDETKLIGRPSEGLEGPLVNLAAFTEELMRPTLLPKSTVALATTVAFPGLVGVVPGFGRFDPCDWGLGFELHAAKTPHWMGRRNSPSTVGHFGGAGTFLWIDPTVELGLVVLTDRPFGPWAVENWPRFSDEVLVAAEARPIRRSQTQSKG